MKVIEKGVKACEQVEGKGLKNVGKKLVWPFKEKEMKDLMVQLGD
jgi:hypothetical protein